MYYTIEHLTRYRYSAPIRENIMEVRMQPRTEGPQHCSDFKLTITPQAQPLLFQDYLGNLVHHFNIPGQHVQLTVKAQAKVEIQPSPELPESLPQPGWAELARLAEQADFWDMRQPSRFAQATPLLTELAGEFNLNRRIDPLRLLRRLNAAMYETFAYTPDSTEVDSGIDQALATRQGVCQDFSHIMIALARQMGIPCRYVSGYLYHLKEEGDRSAEDASHAWVEAYLPELGWVGFDPTNNLIAAERHIRVAMGRDYADVPPSRGIFKGEAKAELTVGVRVGLADAPPAPDDLLPADSGWETPPVEEEFTWRQQQQQ
jgi:transglutaminase-like putative cysteine protease